MKTTQEHLDNCLLFLECWKRVNPKSVIPDLQYWQTSESDQPTECGTLCCAGGWLPNFPEFRKLGVHRSTTGAPAIAKSESPQYYYGSQVAELLFGSDLLFERRGLAESLWRTDHECVTNRFRNQVEDLKSLLTEEAV